MNKIISATLISLAAASAFLLFAQTAVADTREETYCYPVTEPSVSRDPAYHPRAYVDGYRQGQSSAKKGEAYKPRTAGGEFARGFDDGYYGKEFIGQRHVVPNDVNYQTTQRCAKRTIYYKK